VAAAAANKFHWIEVFHWGYFFAGGTICDTLSGGRYAVHFIRVLQKHSHCWLRSANLVMNKRICVCIRLPRNGDPVGIFTKMFSIGKTGMTGLPYAGENMVMLSLFDTIPERDRQTNGWADITAISTLRVSIAMLTRDDINK